LKIQKFIKTGFTGEKKVIIKTEKRRIYSHPVLHNKKNQELQIQKFIKTGFTGEKKVIIKTEKRRISSYPLGSTEKSLMGLALLLPTFQSS
jgi:CDGSH-type Zn-finger protein